MKNKIRAIYNIFTEYNINLSMFIKIAENNDGLLKVMLGMAESKFIDDENDKYIITNGTNLSNMYREELADIVNSREQELNKDKTLKEHPTVEDVKNWIYCDYTEEQLAEKVINKLEKIVFAKIFLVIKKNNENIKEIQIKDANDYIIFSGNIET